jgi:hypothetical protein
MNQQTTLAAVAVLGGPTTTIDIGGLLADVPVTVTTTVEAAFAAAGLGEVLQHD